MIGPGTEVGRWRLVEPVGRGGLAVVWRAVDARGDAVAIKILEADRATEEEIQRMEREHRVLSAIDHPNVVKALDIGVVQGRHWLAMELVQGPNLDELVGRWSRQEPPDRFVRAERLLRELLAALEHVHAQGLVHRDIKPSNVLVGPDEHARLSDFGAVKSADASLGGSALTQAGRLVGTVAFMAPEQITGDPVDQRSDLYSLGAVLYWVLTGRRVAESDTIAGWLARHLMERPVPPIERDPRVPTLLDEVCLRLLRKNPTERYSSAAEVLAALDSGPSGPALMERDAVMEALEAAARDARIVSVSGPPGSGRSSVLSTLARRFPQAQVADDFDRLSATERARLLRKGGQLLISVSPDEPMLPGERRVSLDPLSRGAITTLLRAAGLPAPAVAILGRRLMEASGGWPKALVEGLDALVEEGWLHRQGKGLALDKGLDELRSAPLPLARSVRRALLEELEALPPAVRAGVDALAVLGDDAEGELLDALAPGAGSALRSHPIASRREEGFHELWRLRRPELRRLALEQMGDELRARLNLQAADQLLAVRRRSGAIAERAATHLVAAGEKGRAYPLLVQTAWRALRRHNASEALELADRALACRGAAGRLPRPEAAALHQQALTARGQALIQLSRPELAVRALEAALEAGREHPDPVLAETRAWLGAAKVDLGEHQAGLALLRQALDALPGDAAIRFAVLRSVADAQLARGEVAAARDTWRRALAEVPSREGAAWLGLGELELAHGSPDAAHAALSAAERKLREQDDARPLAIALVLEAEQALHELRLRSAQARIDEALRVARAAGHADLLGRALTWKAQIMATSGAWEEATSAAVEALELAPDRLSPWDAAALVDVGARVVGPGGLPERPTLPPLAGPRGALDAVWRARATLAEGHRADARLLALDAESTPLADLDGGLLVRRLGGRAERLEAAVQRARELAAPEHRAALEARLRAEGL